MTENRTTVTEQFQNWQQQQQQRSNKEHCSDGALY
jgi:hypothetical protein